MWCVRWRREGESSSGAGGACRGGSERLQPVGLWRKSWRQSLLQIFVCRNVFRHRPVIGCTLEPFALYAAQQASSKCRPTHTVQSAERLRRAVPCSPGLVLTLVGWRPVCRGGAANVFLFQRDFFTVCFSPALCVRGRSCILGQRRGLGASECHKSPEFSLWLTDIT